MLSLSTGDIIPQLSRFVKGISKFLLQISERFPNLSYLSTKCVSPLVFEVDLLCDGVVNHADEGLAAVEDEFVAVSVFDVHGGGLAFSGPVYDLALAVGDVVALTAAYGTYAESACGVTGDEGNVGEEDEQVLYGKLFAGGSVHVSHAVVLVSEIFAGFFIIHEVYGLDGSGLTLFPSVLLMNSV